MCIFALGPATVPRSFFVSPICLPLFPSVIGRLSPGRFEFQIPRDHRVDRRGNNRLSSVSTRLCAVICFRRPRPRPRGPVIRNRHRDLRRGISALLFMAPPGMYQN